MPVDLIDEVEWPVFFREFQTDSDTPVVIVLAELPAAGDAVLLPMVQLVGRTEDGSIRSTLIGSYVVTNDRGTLRLSVGLEVLPDGDMPVAVAVVGTEVHLQATGRRGEIVLWGAHWKAFDLRARPLNADDLAVRQLQIDAARAAKGLPAP